VLLILGISALVRPLIVARQLIRLDVPLMVGLSVLVLVMGMDGALGRIDGLLLFGGAIVYTVFLIRQSRKESQAGPGDKDETGPKIHGTKQVAAQLALILVGLGLLVLGANWLINGAVVVARLFGVSELVIGLTVVALGTSLPEIATSVIASMRGERDIAVGNIVGSNIFNILSVLGVSALVSPAGIAVSATAMQFDIPIMIVVAAVCLPIFFTGSLVARWEGLIFLSYYVAYTVYQFISATAPQSLPGFQMVITVAVLPVTVAVLLASVWNSHRTGERYPTPAFLQRILPDYPAAGD
jgi:cation:H+ antiporter